MGKYINNIGTTYAQKCAALVTLHNAIEISNPTEFQENLVCVVDNGVFAAAAYVHDQREFGYFTQTKNDDRPRRWFVVQNAKNLAV